MVPIVDVESGYLNSGYFSTKMNSGMPKFLKKLNLYPETLVVEVAVLYSSSLV